jgi:hypothetical protein
MLYHLHTVRTERIAANPLEELGVDAIAEQLFPIEYADEEAIVHGMVYRLVHDGPFRLQVEEIVRGKVVPVAPVLEDRAADGPDQTSHRRPERRSPAIGTISQDYRMYCLHKSFLADSFLDLAFAVI